MSKYIIKQNKTQKKKKRGKPEVAKQGIPSTYKGKGGGTGWA